MSRFELRFWRKSLVTRLVVSFLLLSLMTVALLGWVTFREDKRSLRSSVFDRLEVAADLQVSALRQWVDDQQREFRLLAELPSMVELSAELLRHDVSDERHAEAAGRLSEMLRIVLAGKPDWREILILAHDSEILLSTDAGQQGDYRIFDRFFIEGRSAFYAEKVYPSPITSQPTMTFSTPLVADGEPRGVLAVHLDLEHLDEIGLERQELSGAGASYLVDGFNELVSGRRFGREDLPRGVHSEAISAALAGHDGSRAYLDYEGVPVLGVYRWIDELAVALMTELPQREAFAPARELARTTLLAGAAAALVLAVGIYLLALQIARPILAITDSAVRVASGDLGARAPVLTGDEVGVLARTFNGMTERLKTSYEKLEQEIAERRRAQDEREALIGDLEAKNAELERFTYTVSHDLKSPLVTIRGFLGFLKKDLESGDLERMQSDIDKIDGASQKMRGLLNDLLELSRIGRLMNPPELLKLDELVQEALDMVAGQISAAGVAVTVQPDLPAILGDRTRLLEVFQNLLSNAVKFSGERERPQIEIGACDAGGEVLCHVRDNGVGIEPRYHEKIFGLFDKLDRHSEGSGIGLALVKRIIEVHGGRIWVESEPGAGAAFFFSLQAPPDGEPASIGPADITGVS